MLSDRDGRSRRALSPFFLPPAHGGASGAGVRARGHGGGLWQQLVAEKKLKSGDRLPPVLLLVLYNGEQRWTAPRRVTDLIALPPDSALSPWQPQVRYHVLDMGAFPGSDLVRRESLAALLFRLEQRHQPDELAGLIDEVIPWFRRHPGYEALKSLFTELVRQAMEGFGTPLAIPNDLLEMKTMLATQGEAWKRQWKAEGKAEGKAEVLVRLAEKRFGPLPAGQRDRILAADEASVEAWLDRLMEAPGLDAIFESRN